MVLLKINGLAYPILYTAQIMDTHSYDDLLSCTLYTKHLIFSPSLYSNSIGMLSSSNQLLLIVMLLEDPQPKYEIYDASRILQVWK
jgi:hypothetical protein